MLSKRRALCALVGTAIVAGAAAPAAKTYPNSPILDYPVKPRKGVYVTVRGSRLYYGNRRLRLWGVCRHATDDFTISRLRRTGFNAIRMWGDHDFYDVESGKAGRFRVYTKGDGSGFDRWDRSLAECKRAGLFVMCPSTHYVSKHFRKGVLQDGSFLSGGDDWQEWRHAMQEKGVHFGWLKYFDERVRRIYLRHAANFLDHVNPYTGKRNAEEEVFCLFENDNENGFLKWPLERGFQGWQPYFREKLRKCWNDRLRDRYRTEGRLKAAWGRIGKDESLGQGTIALAPIFTERNRYPEARARDFLRFMVGLVTEFNDAFRQRCRRQAPRGVGVNVIPFLFDTQFRNNTSWLYANSKADVNSFGMYISTLTSTLTVPPSIYVVDSTSLGGKPTVLYEVNTTRPSPYRTEYPFKLAALGSRQDWDGVFWHYWNTPADTDEGFLAGPMPIVKEKWADGGIYHANDPVMTSALALAGQVFLNETIPAAPAPTIFRLGKTAPFKYEWFNGVSLRGAVFGPGAHIEFDAEQEEDLVVIGERIEGPLKRAVAAGESVLWDWPNGRLIVDGPLVKAYIGRPVHAYRFKDGIVLRGVDTEFVSFALVSADGRPLAGRNASRRMLTHAMFDAKNTGFEFDWSIARAGGGFVSPKDQAKAVRSPGRAPVVVDEVAYRVEFPARLEATVSEYDFALRKIATRRPDRLYRQGGTNRIAFAGDGARWMSVVEVTRRGRAVDTALSSGDGELIVKLNRARLAGEAAGELSGSYSGGWARAGGVWNPIRGLGWHMSYAAAHQFLRDSTLAISSISREDPASGKIVLSDAELVLGAPGTVEIRFRDGRMVAINVTFTQPPPFDQASRDLRKALGKPGTSKRATHAWQESVDIWKLRQKGLALSVTLKEFQGTMGVEFVLSE